MLPGGGLCASRRRALCFQGAGSVHPGGGLCASRGRALDPPGCDWISGHYKQVVQLFHSMLSVRNVKPVNP